MVGRALGRRKPDDAWVLKMNQTINKSTLEQAADAVAAALAEGMDPEAVGEAISLAANQLVLRSTSSRTHGNSLGVHGSDATNAWRNIARVTDQRNTVASLIVAAYHVAGQGQTVRAHDRGHEAQPAVRIPWPASEAHSRKRIPRPCCGRPKRRSARTTRRLLQPRFCVTAN